MLKKINKYAHTKMRITITQNRCGRLTRRGGPRLRGARHRLKHAATRRAAGGQRLELAEDLTPRGLTCHCTDEASFFFLFRCTSAELFFSCCDSVAAHLKHSDKRPSQAGPLETRAKGCAAGAGGVTTVVTCVSAASKLRPAT
jgi:hypothetical protein